MIIPNTRHSELPPKPLKLGLQVLTVLGIVTLGWLKLTPAQSLGTEEALPSPLALHQLEETLLLSNPSEYPDNLARWQQASASDALAGVVVESTKGELIAGTGAFLDADGRLYHDASSTPPEGHILQELEVRPIELVTKQGKSIQGRLRVFTFMKD